MVLFSFAWLKQETIRFLLSCSSDRGLYPWHPACCKAQNLISQFNIACLILLDIWCLPVKLWSKNEQQFQRYEMFVEVAEPFVHWAGRSHWIYSQPSCNKTSWHVRKREHSLIYWFIWYTVTFVYFWVLFGLWFWLCFGGFLCILHNSLHIKHRKGLTIEFSVWIFLSHSVWKCAHCSLRALLENISLTIEYSLNTPAISCSKSGTNPD